MKCVLVCVLCALSLFASSFAVADDGTFYGRIRHADGWQDVTTTFDPTGGRYEIADGTSGRLTLLGEYPAGHVGNMEYILHLYEWQDEYGTGLLRVYFRGRRFTGEWSKPGTHWPVGQWDGTKPTGRLSKSP
jgi:hypothetical protein